ncbi:hypothetical protein SADUNF_Sadunf04G0116700 [Salix dunnii]|uniref:Uncharacterized protein n=1 Tax=Salix dunnii TaxID=1413687 RepID=A0A835K571_9ROSI|nr:hypothetical protein SADUNF_Sadunf04G0116700 [Salix dunnii]
MKRHSTIGGDTLILILLGFKISPQMIAFSALDSWYGENGVRLLTSIESEKTRHALLEPADPDR